MRSNEELLQILEMNTVKEPNGCWLWQGGKNSQGYGYVQIDYIQFAVHRLSAYIHHGLTLIIKEELALHKTECPNKNCWNPDHLYVGTHQENTRDMDSLGRAKRGRYKTHCPKGHEYTPENTRIDKKGAQVCKTCNRNRMGYWK